MAHASAHDPALPAALVQEINESVAKIQSDAEAVDDADAANELLRSKFEVLGKEHMLDCVTKQWNEGTFEGKALGGRMKKAMSAPDMDLAAITFGAFTEPTGKVKLLCGKLHKGATARHSSAGPGFYAVESDFALGDSSQRAGTSTAMGHFTVDPNNKILNVEFDRVELALVDKPVETRHIKPRKAELRILLMAPGVTVTHSNLGSVTMLRPK